MTVIDSMNLPDSIPETQSFAPQSRRERPAKPALTRERVIATALEIVNSEGIAKATMRRIASQLDTGPASLYVYVRNTEDLYAQILDALLAPITPITSAGSWRERLIGLLASYTNVLFEHPQIARLSMTTRPSGAHYLAVVESILTLLSEGGVPNRGAAWAVDLLLDFATATAAASEMGTAKLTASVHPTSLEQAITAASSERYPHIATLGSEMLSGDASTRFTWGLNVIINGVMSTPRPRP